VLAAGDALEETRGVGAHGFGVLGRECDDADFGGEPEGDAEDYELAIGDDGEYTERFYEIRDRMAAFFAESLQ
jgi:hypothetical protein